MTNPLESRLAAIERAVGLLSEEIRKIRTEMERGEVVEPERPATKRERPSVAAAVSSAEFENLVGRYGMLAIAVLAAVAAVGTFLKWAVGHGYLTFGPAARVDLGLVFAAGLTLWGLRLRRNERSFGSSIVGLGLVIGMVCAYAAGPSFHLVPTIVAFVGAAGASWILAIFAHSENDEPLWCVAFGGAAVAPFVTSDGGGNIYALAGYGLLVLLPACFAISHRSWVIAWRVFYLASALLILAVAFMSHTAETLGYIAALAFPFIVAGAGIVPFAPDSMKRGALRWLGLLAAMTTLAENTTLDPKWVVTTVSVTSIALWLILVDRLAAVPQSTILERQHDSADVFDWIDAAVIPVLLATPPMIAFVWRGEAVLSYALAALIVITFSWRRPVGPLRDASAAAAMLFALATVSSLEMETPTGNIAALVALAWLAFAMHRGRPSVSWLAGGAVLLGAVAAWSATALLDRRAFTFTPFATEASLTALVVLIGLTVPARFVSLLRESTIKASRGDGRRPDDGLLMLADRLAAFAPWTWGFAWVVMELSMTFSPSTSTLLLVVWYALSAVVCVGVGRAKGWSRLRQVGLVLAIITAVTALYGASTYFETGARITAYLVTAAFLLGIAYWYRRPGTTGDEGKVAVGSHAVDANQGGSM